MEQSVDGGWWIAGAGDRQRRTLNAVVGEVRRRLIPETPVNGYGKLVLHSLRGVKPVQFIVK